DRSGVGGRLRRAGDPASGRGSHDRPVVHGPERRVRTRWDGGNDRRPARGIDRPRAARPKGTSSFLIRDALPSMLVELSVVEQRYQAVLAVIRDGVPVVEVASRFGVSRQAVHRWLRRYEAQGLGGLAV